MSNKLALVVDDSRMARHVLSKMLQEQGIEVDSVETGEEALGYLCGKKPSMIFMDHTMPGMDGFQCLRAIKNDPNTAMIPIIMYTSKEGEVYESQARALGAVGVLPKTLKPLMLAKVLERQNLLPAVGLTPANTTQVGPTAANDVVIVDAETPDTTLSASTPAPTVSAKAEEHPELEALENRIEQLTSQLQGISRQGESYGKRSFRLQYFGLGLGALLIGWLLFSNNQLAREMSSLRVDKDSLEDNLQQQSQQNQAMRTQLDSQLSSQQKLSDVHNRRFYDSIEWALNEDGRFGWNEKPFDDTLATTLSRLTQNLHAVGFRGEISIRSHLGRFCVTTAANGETQLPEPGATLSSCDIMQFNPALTESVGMDQSAGFERFLAAFQAEYGNDIQISLSTLGDRRPVARYPSQDPDTSAERWNQAAARNQRIEVSINPR